MERTVRTYRDTPAEDVTPNSLDDNEAASGLLRFDLMSLFRRSVKWRPADSLVVLKAQVDNLAPGRNRISDGILGDARHRRRRSDHNPNIINDGVGVVTAIDITHDRQGGCDADAIAESLRFSQDVRIKYVIWNRQIYSSTTNSWEWRDYVGTNPHTTHIHVSVVSETQLYDLTDEWRVAVA